MIKFKRPRQKSMEILLVLRIQNIKFYMMKTFIEMSKDKKNPKG